MEKRLRKERATRRSRRKKTNTLSFIIAVSLILAMLFIVFVRVIAGPLPEPVGTIHVAVRQGDTLWDIAEEYMPEGTDIRHYIYEIQKLNKIGDYLRIGQVLEIPIYDNEKND